MSGDFCFVIETEEWRSSVGKEGRGIVIELRLVYARVFVDYTVPIVEALDLLQLFSLCISMSIGSGRRLASPQW